MLLDDLVDFGDRPEGIERQAERRRIQAQDDLGDWLIIDLVPEYLRRAGDGPAAVKAISEGCTAPAIFRDR